MRRGLRRKVGLRVIGSRRRRLIFRDWRRIRWRRRRGGYRCR
jgi:hypothetical protein